eukprot:TRINITY_DN9313_c0_g2_i1.p1 TRINITY_DN9313_c0_g2~~TRINITY_DN9313_c0_g2_i1.p1  ORF type:complete len:154 (+),score=18.91 TRINITY_DN9313_c0_g2_i1:149-610(+)
MSLAALTRIVDITPGKSSLASLAQAAQSSYFSFKKFEQKLPVCDLTRDSEDDLPLASLWLKLSVGSNSRKLCFFYCTSCRSGIGCWAHTFHHMTSNVLNSVHGQVMERCGCCGGSRCSLSAAGLNVFALVPVDSISGSLFEYLPVLVGWLSEP